MCHDSIWHESHINCAMHVHFQIIDWLNECNERKNERCEAIKKIQELLMHSGEELLDEFLENILAFSHDPVQDVRRAVVGFIEELS